MKRQANYSVKEKLNYWKFKRDEVARFLKFIDKRIEALEKLLKAR